jgi:hypothetical protein
VNPAGGYTITTQVWRATGRIVIDGTEVTQGIQNKWQEVALIGGKRQATLTVYGPAYRTGSFPIVKHTPLSFGPIDFADGDRHSMQLLQRSRRVGPAAKRDPAGVERRQRLVAGPPIDSVGAVAPRPKNALPVAHLAVNDDAPAGAPYSDWGGHWFDCKPIVDTNTGMLSCSGYIDESNWESTYIDQKYPNGGCYGMICSPRSTLAGTVGPRVRQRATTS